MNVGKGNAMVKLLFGTVLAILAGGAGATVGPWDADVSAFPRAAGENGDSARILRAVEAAGINSRNFSIPARIILADDGIASCPGSEGVFDVFVGNPPYYSDYRIAEVFLDTAKRALKNGGTCYTVVKNEAGLKPVQERYFKHVEVIPRRGYSVLNSIAES